MCARFTEPTERLIVAAGLNELKRLTSEFTRKSWPTVRPVTVKLLSEVLQALRGASLLPASINSPA
ncbi:unnamed protein product [Gemmata massiliana]|uniref:Uncharacterized protein n=2 Tax=Gemmata massiliana TaxID=1210884 RepID=A0A6P2D6C7_9BACT|nr:unnamed protein product [Gemmata massiliana]